MNSNSLICNFISNNEDWERRLMDEYSIKTHHDETYSNIVVFNYSIGADFSIPIVQEARGIIIDLDTYDVLCWPFRKFGNWNESYADKIDWNYAVARQKIDGSLIKLFWNPMADKWWWATNGTTDAKDASVMDSEKTFYDVILSADNYPDVNYENLDIDMTYMFELVSPMTQVVISYPVAHLYHIGTRNNITGKELNTDIGVEQPRDFKVSDLESVIAQANAINGEDVVVEEGYVVVDREFNRIKVKSPKYLLMHSQLNNHIATKKRLLNDIFLEKELHIHDKRMSAKYAFYKYKIEELIMYVDVFVHYVRALYDEVSQDRYAVYEAIKEHPLSQFGLKAIENDQDAETLINQIYNTRRETFMRMIPDYEISYDRIIKGEIDVGA